MSEVMLYRLADQAPETMLPALLETCLARNWRVTIQTRSADQSAAIDKWLWSYRDDSFLPHGLCDDQFADEMPVIVTSDARNINDARVRIMLDLEASVQIDGYERVVYIYDGGDLDAVAAAARRKGEADAGNHQVAVFHQSATGRWKKISANSEES